MFVPTILLGVTVSMTFLTMLEGNHSHVIGTCKQALALLVQCIWRNITLGRVEVMTRYGKHPFFMFHGTL